MRKHILSVVLGVALAVIARPSSAQNTGFAINRFDVAEVGSDWFAGDSLDFRPSLRPAFGLTGDWANKPLVRYDANGNEVAAIIKNQVNSHLQASLVFAERFRLALNLPMLQWQSREIALVDGLLYAPAKGVRIGDLRLAGDVRLLGKYGEAFSLAVGAQLHLPTGDRAAFSGDGKVRIAPRLLVAGDISMFAYSVRAAFNYRAQDSGFGGVPTGSELAFVATAGVRLFDRQLLVGPEAWGSTGVSGDTFFKQANTPVELLFGAHYFLGPMRFGLGVGPGLSRGIGAPAYRVLGSVAYVAPAEMDRDSDGVLDGDDACPDVPGVLHEDPAKNGCPADRDNDSFYDADDACPDVPGVADEDPAKNGCPADRDGDGIQDEADACPDVFGVANEDPAKNGCPADRDGDGIYDEADACPDVFGVANEDPAKNGCPADRDGDGIADEEDACPDLPGVKNEDPAKNGCPADRDGDSIYDKDDACPDVPGLVNDDPEQNGCPIARVEKGQIKITQRIEFETDSAKLLPVSDGVLEAVLAILNEHSEITQVLVQGHTDNVGKARYNVRLSKQRAAAVVDWLVKHGIDKTRLRSEGKGSEVSIASNDTEEGRQKNRRVEFHIELVNGKPPVEETAAPAAETVPVESSSAAPAADAVQPEVAPAAPAQAPAEASSEATSSPAPQKVEE